MNVHLIEFPVDPDPEKNIDALKDWFVPNKDVHVLPELWDCVYDNGKIIEAADCGRRALEEMKEQAKAWNTWVVGGTIPWKEEGRIYNRCFVINRQGDVVCHYDKVHLMRTPHYSEADVFSPGNRFVDFDLEGTRCGILVCYDIRLPEPARILAKRGAEVLFVPGAFNTHVGPHWEILLSARALENEVYVAGCSPKYSYGKYTAYGHSQIRNPEGQLTGTIDKAKLAHVREKMPVWDVRRDDLYEVEDKI